MLQISTGASRTHGHLQSRECDGKAFPARRNLGHFIVCSGKIVIGHKTCQQVGPEMSPEKILNDLEFYVQYPEHL